MVFFLLFSDEYCFLERESVWCGREAGTALWICCLVLQGSSLISYSPRMDAGVSPKTLIMVFSLRYIRFQNI
jgi:hypothetical protein